ncbi:MAG: ABC transporter permease [Christensenellaceae bacterium]|jgi:ribose transport system permease protein
MNKECEVKQGNRFQGVFKKYGIFIILAALVIVLSLLDSSFMTPENLKNVLRQCSVYAILAFGMTFVVIAGGIDLSVGALVALSSSIVALFIVKAGMNMWVAVVLTVLIAGGFGFANGFFIAKLKVPFFIATSGMMYIARGLALVLTNESPVSGLPAEFSIFGGMPEWVIPPQVIIMIGVFIVCFILLNHTRMGRYTFAIGSSEKAAKQSGVNVNKYKMYIFMISGITAGISGVIMASRLKTGSPIIGDGYELDAIAAVAIGGTSMSGGSGSIVRSWVGALVLTVIRVGLNILGVSTSLQQIIIGAVIIGVVAIDMVKTKQS